jgi:hypothetical protein
MDSYTVLIVEAVKPSIIGAVERLRAEHPELGEPRLVLLTSRPKKYREYEARGVAVVPCDYKPNTVRQIVAGLPAQPKAVICRGELYIQYLRKIVVYLPPGVLVSSEKSLEIATNKRLMREAFEKHCPQNTPRHVQVQKADEVERVAAVLHFPVIVKPASLASSLMIQKCDNAVELEESLKGVFAELQNVYAHEGRSEPPEVIVEEYLEGDFYSLDSYVLRPGMVYHTPLVNYVPAKQLGIDDFFLYKRTTPVDLPPEAVRGAEQASENAIAAVGLQYSSVHVELVRTGDGSWKIIEIGPRIGRFRNVMYREAFGIDHSYNDVLVHCGLAPDILPLHRRFCAAYSVYPTEEGVLKEVIGKDEVKTNIAHVAYEKYLGVPGGRVHYARNGGHALYELLFSSNNLAEFEAECAWFEANVRAVTDTEDQKK